MNENKMAEEEINRRMLMGARIKKFRKRMGWSQEKCAEELGVSDLTIRRLELNAEHKHRGEYPATKKTARKLEEKTGIFWKYWFGETDHTDEAQYKGALQDLADREQGMSEALAEMDREYEQRVNRYCGLFSMVGYQYENIEHTVIYDMAGLTGEAPIGPHNLVRIGGDGKVVNLSDAQLESLIAYLKKQMDFAIFDLTRPLQPNAAFSSACTPDESKNTGAV